MSSSSSPSRGASRTRGAFEARQIIEMLESGSYVAPSGRRVDVADAVRDSVARTIEYRPTDAVPLVPRTVTSAESTVQRTSIRVVNGTSLASARSMARSGHRPFILNFASAKNPGGGFLGGARAQEESLARSSTLYACLSDREMYRHHRALEDCLYTSWMIHSPDVLVVRDDETGEFLEEPYLATFLTAPAPNAGVVLERDRSRGPAIEAALVERTHRVLASATLHGDRHLVLGAWGCGVFRNDPATVAGIFARALETDFAGAFDEVVFAVLDGSPNRRFIGPFEARFGAS